MAKYTIEEVRKLFDDRGYDLISTEYKDVTSKLQYICREHQDKGIQEITFKDLQKGCMCVYCRYDKGLPYNKPWPEDILKDATEKLNCDYISSYSKNYKTIIRFICREHPWKGIQETLWINVKNNKNICGVCNGNNRNTYDFKMMMEKINPDIEIIGEYKYARENISCRCKIDGHEWVAKAYNLLSGFGCPICGLKKRGLSRRVTYEDKIAKLQKIHPDIEFLSVPELVHDNVKCRCKICGAVWEATYVNLTKEHKPTGCPHCTYSQSEKSVMSLLDKWDIKYKTQYRFDDLRDIHKLPFDFYLEYSGVLIEFDGEQHYKLVHRFKDDPDFQRAKREFDIIVKHDNMKSDYCFGHNIPLIRIPYWHRDDLEYFLFDEFVKYGVIELI